MLENDELQTPPSYRRRKEKWPEACGLIKNFLAGLVASHLETAQFFASINKASRCEESRENREQLRCCIWLRVSIGQSRDISPAAKAETRLSQESEYLPGMLSFVSPRVRKARENFFARKKNEGSETRAAALHFDLSKPWSNPIENSNCLRHRPHRTGCG